MYILAAPELVILRSAEESIVSVPIPTLPVPLTNIPDVVSGFNPGPNTNKLFVLPAYLVPTIISCPPASNLMYGSPPLFVLVFMTIRLCVPELEVKKVAVCSVALLPVLVKLNFPSDPVAVIGPPVTSIPPLKLVLPSISTTPLLCILNLCALAVAS